MGKQAEQGQTRTEPASGGGSLSGRGSLREMFPDLKFMDYEEGMKVARRVVAENREALEKLSRT